MRGIGEKRGMSKRREAEKVRGVGRGVRVRGVGRGGRVRDIGEERGMSKRRGCGGEGCGERSESEGCGERRCELRDKNGVD